MRADDEEIGEGDDEGSDEPMDDDATIGEDEEGSVGP